MGACLGLGSKNKDCRARLDDVKRDVEALPEASGDEGLHDVAACASELQDIMQALLDDRARDQTCLRRVEGLSEDLLANLDARITVDLLRRTDFEFVRDAILRVAEDLNATRASSATEMIEESIARAREKINLEEEKKAKGHLVHLKEAVDGMKDPAKLVPQAGQVLDLIEKAHAEAPGSKQVTDMLLKCVINLSSMIFRLKASWLVDTETAKGVKGIAEWSDTIARKLVPVMGATWDPPMTPHVEHEISNHAGKLCTAAIAAAEKELARSNVGGAFDELDGLKPWWPHLQGAEAPALQVVGLFSKVHTHATQEFISATKDGDAETAAAIRDFAGKFDVLRTAFEGLPPPTEEEARGLVATLVLGEAKAAVEKHLGVLDVEVAKATKAAKGPALSLAATVQALEALVPVWATVLEADAAFGERLQRTCGALEAWAEGAAGSCPTAKVDSLLGFAEAYDDRRKRLSPPEPSEGLLRPRIAEKAAGAHLKAVEAELKKDKGLNPLALLDSLRAASAALKKEGGSEEIRGRLLSAFSATEDRVVKTFSEVVAAADARKEDMLQQFAMGFDEARALCGLAEAEGSEGLAGRLREERGRVVERQLQAVEEELLKETAPDLAVVLKALAVLRAVLPRLPEGSPLPSRVDPALAPLEGRLDEAGRAAAEAGDVGAADTLLRQARELDEALAALRPEEAKAAPLRPRLLGPAVDAHASCIEAVLGKEGGSDCAVLARELAAVQPLCQEEGCPVEACQRLLGIIESLEAPLMKMAADVNLGSMDAVLRAAAAADSARTAAEQRTGAEPAAASNAMHRKLESTKAVVAKLGGMDAELAKPSGMNPKAVLQALAELEPLWLPVCEAEPFRARLAEALGKFHGRLAEACGKALGAEAKIKALLDFAQEADAKQQALVTLTPGLEVKSFQQALSRVVADSHLKGMEAELSKDSGMSPANLLKAAAAVGALWPQLGQADAMAPEFDEVMALRKRLNEVSSKVHSRMTDSMRDAMATGNVKKKAALLKFARDYDTAVGELEGVEGGGGLLASLETQAGEVRF